MTAARRSTMMGRLDMLPTCDAVVCEGGSRMIVNGQLEAEYTDRFEDVCGPMDRQFVGEDERLEPLWRYYRELQEKVPGLSLDTNDYFGMFRVSALGDEATEDALQTMLQPSKIPPGVSVNSNLGKTDLFPTRAGKANAVQYLQEKYGIDRLETACLFDDDNDLLMAEQCGVHFLPSLTSFSIKNAVKRHPRWYIPKTVGQGVFATEECLKKILERVLVEQQQKNDVEHLMEEVRDSLPQGNLERNQTTLEEKKNLG
jgi:hydroxymethylpyrimidine pyrophosphatase-like HAD family hydrolase